MNLNTAIASILKSDINIDICVDAKMDMGIE